MTLPPFALHRPRSLEEVEDLLEQHGDDAVVYCGGTELLLVMKLGLAAYPNLVDLKGVPELRVLEERDGRLCVGAAVTHRELESSPFVHGLFPALAEMERRVANVRVRSVGTLGGNLCFSDPHSDPNLLLGLHVESGADQLRVAGEIAADAVAPLADLNGSVEYKRNLVRVFVSRCCTTVMERLSSE